MTAPVPSARRVDPDRRDRIIDACLAVIARDGVAGTSHRRVAAEADVPLGSMTYYFTGMDDLLEEAFSKFATAAAHDFAERMAAASAMPEPADAIAAAIVRIADDDPEGLVVMQELYTLAARRPAFRRLTREWMENSRRTLERTFDPATARILDALIEGLSLHRALDGDVDDRTVADALARVIRN